MADLSCGKERVCVCACGCAGLREVLAVTEGKSGVEEDVGGWVGVGEGCRKPSQE